MLKLDSKLTLDAKAIQAKNLTSRFTEKELQDLGEWCHDGYKRDLQSRSKWERRTEAAMDLAMQIQKDKSFPWPGCSNIAFPLVTIGTLQFHARSYPVIINGTDIVKCRTIGDDSKGLKRQRADRISSHMSYQCLEQDKSWVEQHDRLLINVPCVGTAFTKDYYVPSKGYPCTELVLARDLVLDYWAKSVEECPRKTHRIPLFRNQIYEKIMRGTFRDCREAEWYKQLTQPTPPNNQGQQDNRAGLTPSQPDETTPFMTLEQHVNVDLDQDGYAEPYIITYEEQSLYVLRIVTGFDREEDIERVVSGSNKGEIIQIHSMQYFTKYGFIPSPDGGIMDIGFGILLGPLNESVNSILNQLVDAGTVSITAGGFLGRGAKMRGGVYTFAPFQWQRVDASGDDLRKSIFPLPVRDPNSVMFQLLNLLIGYANRVSGATDMMVGENPGQNTPAETSRTMQVQGEKIYSSIYKRIWNSMKEEFKKRYIINAIYMKPRAAYGDSKLAYRDDYMGSPDDVCPEADPNLTSEAMAQQQAVILKQAAATTPGYNLEAVERRFLKTMKISGIDEIYPGPKKVPPLTNPKVQIEQLRQGVAAQKLQFERQRFVTEMQEQVRVNNAQIAKMQAEVIKLMNDIDVDRHNAMISAFNAQIAAMKQHNESLLGQVDRILAMMEQDIERSQSDGGEGESKASPDKGREGAGATGGGIPGMEGTPGDAASAASSGAPA